MNITITRVDPLGGIPDNSQHGIELSAEHCATWQDVVDTLKRYGVNLTAKQLEEFHAEAPSETITFQNREMLTTGVAAYLCNVNYTITVAP